MMHERPKRRSANWPRGSRAGTAARQIFNQHCFSAPAILCGRNALERSEDCRHRVVDPEIDGPEVAFDPFRRLLDRFRVGDVGHDPQRPGTLAAQLLGRGLEPR
jgi:hypothetical protein